MIRLVKAIGERQFIVFTPRAMSECNPGPEAPRLTRSMRITLDDLELDHLAVVYPGAQTYPLTERVTVVPLEALVTDDGPRPVRLGMADTDYGD